MLEQIGRYEILDRIAVGGQGTVYRARDTVLDRVVGVKVINQPVADDPAYLDALQREAQLAAGLEHTNINTVYDFQVEDGIAFIVMEYVPDSLDKHLSHGRRVPWRRAVEIAAQIARALEHAHENNVVHRDIKPQNILIRATGTASVCDFGIARALASSIRSRTTSVKGTPSYMAPEQWAGETVDGRLDQYALGILLYEIISGTLPFQGDSIESLYLLHREAPMPPLPAELEVPSAVEEIIRRATSKKAYARYVTSGAMAIALEGVLAGPAKDGQIPAVVNQYGHPKPPIWPYLPPIGDIRSGGNWWDVLPLRPLLVGFGIFLIFGLILIKVLGI